MTKAQHTPGPWEARGVLVKAGLATITHCGGHLHPIPQRVHEAEANARLIGAAPELLAALDMLHRYNQTDLAYHNTPAAAAAHAAIAKATGGQP